MMKQQYEDYKYVMQDTYQLYLGSRYTFREILNNEEIPFKFRLIAERYLYQEIDPETTLESLFYYLEEDNIQFRIFKQLKMKVKANVIVEKKSLTGKVKKVYTTQVIPVQQLVTQSPAQKEAVGMVIQEIMCSKLAMMAF